MIIKKWNTSTTAWEEQYPKTTINNIYESNGTSTFLNSGKIRVNYLPDLIFGGLNFEGTLTSTNADTDAEMAALLDAVYQARGSVNLEGMVGSYWVANASFDQNISMQSFQAGSTGRYYETTSNYNMEEGQGPTADDITLEAGDWLVIQGVSGSGTQADPFVVDFSVVNNTYRFAGNNTAGIVKLGYTENGKNYPVELDGSQKAFVNVPWVDTNTFRTITAGGNTLGASETLAFTEGSNVTITESGGAVTIASTNTTYSAGSGIGLTGTTFSVAAGNGLTQEANGLAHADTSSQASSNNSGRTYIQSISVDTYGHITSLSTATETVSDTTYSAGNGISLSGTTFSVANGQGLTQESSGLAMTYPVYHGDTLPTLTSSSIYSNVIGFEW